ncbi:MAG: DoxX family protein [Bacteroidales bacterium]|nr:DoxX family protein [Bacteroidales bacterium]
MSKSIKILKLILRVLLGLFFIATAVLKLFSLDNFEIYIYSFKLFSFTFSTLVARCVIMAELLLGALLIAKIQYKPAWWATMAMLVGFTFLLIYVAIFRHDSNCHCMGDLVKINPLWSIVKNVVTMLLMLLVRKEDDYQFRGKVAVGVTLLVAAFAVPFACFPMDSVYNLFDKDGQPINDKLFVSFLQDSTAQSLNINEGNYMLGYLASGCQYCRVSARKVNTIMDNNQLDKTKVIFFIWGSDDGIQEFKDDTEAFDYQYVKINPVEAVNLVNGSFPTYVFLKDGKVVKAMDLRGITEKDIKAFLNE